MFNIKKKTIKNNNKKKKKISTYLMPYYDKKCLANKCNSKEKYISDSNFLFESDSIIFDNPKNRTLIFNTQITVK